RHVRHRHRRGAGHDPGLRAQRRAGRHTPRRAGADARRVQPRLQAREVGALDPVDRRLRRLWRWSRWHARGLRAPGVQRKDLMTGTEDHVASTTFRVKGVRSEDDVREALQGLYDVFTELGLGQATFEVSDTDVARLIVKHKEAVTPDQAAIEAALTEAGSFKLVD